MCWDCGGGSEGELEHIVAELRCAESELGRTGMWLGQSAARVPQSGGLGRAHHCCTELGNNPYSHHRPSSSQYPQCPPVCPQKHVERNTTSPRRETAQRRQCPPSPVPARAGGAPAAPRSTRYLCPVAAAAPRGCRGASRGGGTPGPPCQARACSRTELWLPHGNRIQGESCQDFPQKNNKLVARGVLPSLHNSQGLSGG